MAAQILDLGTEAAYVGLKGTKRSWNIEDSPRTIYFRGIQWRITAGFSRQLGGAYDRSCGAHEDHDVTVTHNIGGDEARLVIQRFVKAVSVRGNEYQTTTGEGYLGWSPARQVDDANALQAFCESKFLPLRLQNDGPSEKPGKLIELGETQFRIHDAPGLHLTTPEHFPLAFLMGFILRVTVVTPDGTANEVAEFPYRSYFEILSDPYTAEFRKSLNVPAGLVASKTLTFDAIRERYDAIHRKMDARPAAKPVAKLVAGAGAGGRRRSF